MPSRPISALLLLVLAALGVAWLCRDDESSGAEAQRALAPLPGSEADAQPGPTLEALGPGDAMQPVDAPTDFLRLAAATRATDEGSRHAALRDIQALFKARKVSLEELVDLVLRAPAEAGSLELINWALRQIGRQPEAAMPFLPRVLALGLGGDKHEQRRAATVLAKIGRVRAEDVDVISRIFAHEGSTYGLKRALVEVLDGLGAEAAPLAGDLMNFVQAVLAERAVAAKDAMEAGIHVSWDHVEFDVMSLLAHMGSAGVPEIARRLAEGLATETGGGDVRVWIPTAVYADALAEAGPEGVAALLALLRTVEADQRVHIVQALSEAPGPDDAIREVLIDALAGSNEYERREAAEALAKHGQGAVSALIDALGDPDAGVRRAAAKSLGALKVRSEEALTGLIQVLKSPDRRAAVSAAETIASFGKDALPALPAMIARMAVDDAALRHWLSGPVAQVALHDPVQLARAYGRGSPREQRGVIAVLPALLPWPAVLDPLLARAIANPDPGIRVQAAILLMPRGHSQALAVLLEGFADDEGAIRTAAIFGLRAGGVGAAGLLPEMIKRLDRDDLYLDRARRHGDERTALGVAIGALGQHNLPLMLEQLGSGSFEREAAAETVLASAGNAGYQLLVRAWPDLSIAQRVAAAELVSQATYIQGPEAAGSRATAEQLARLGLADPDVGVRAAMADNVGRLPKLTGVLLRVLVGLVSGSDPKISFSAAYDLAQLGPKAAPVRKELEALRAHPNREVRTYIVKTLAAISDALR